METLERTEAYIAAQDIWAKMDNNQKTAVRIGMLPAEIMREYQHIPVSALAVALMDTAMNDGGMIA